MKAILLSIFVLLGQSVYAQYTFKKLTQEAVTRTKTPTIAPIPKDFVWLVDLSPGWVHLKK